MTAFTPGPWKVYRASNGSLLGIGDADAGGVTDYQGGFWRDGAEKRANVNLVAAAPELYAMLLRVSRNSGKLSHQEWQQVEAALAKARGEQVSA